MTRRLSTLTLTVILALSVIGPVQASDSPQPNVDATTRWAKTDMEAATAEQVAVNPFKDAEEGLFLIRFQEPALAAYRGGIAGFQATSPAATGASKLNADAPASVAYVDHLEQAHAAAEARIERAVGHDLDVRFRYTKANNGIAAWLTPEEAAEVAKLAGVAHVQADVVRELHTDTGPGWIGAGGIWGTPVCDGDDSCGEGVIVGVIDTGINPSNPSFADIGGDGYDHSNPFGVGNYVGVCDPANAGGGDVKPFDATFPCNDKLIGAWGYNSIDTGEGADNSPFDYDGHGSHTSSTAAGNFVEATFGNGERAAEQIDISGVAPHANVIMYAGCCTLSALTASIDQAVADGVDVINYSIGSPSASDVWNDFDTVGFLAAREAGIFVATSAGNEGPGAETLGSPADAPWLTSAAATTHSRAWVNSVGDFTGGDSALADIEGNGFVNGYGPAPIVYAGDFGDALCLDPFAAGTWTNGEIVVCDRGIAGRVEKGANVLAGGAGGYVLANDAASGESTNSDAHVLPATHIEYDDGVALLAWMATGSGHTATITPGIYTQDPSLGDVVAGFSSRGANRAIDIVSPSLGAPGVDIIAAHGQNDAIEWNFESGTSMASPHVAGAGALLVQQHPEWTPAQIQSALMTTATTEVLDSDEETAADPFDIGSGRVQVDVANDAGLVLDETVENYLGADPAVGGDPKTLNLASVANSQCVLVCSWTRTVEATTSGTWTASVTAGAGVDLTVEPASFSLAAGESEELTITADVVDATPGDWIFGEVLLTEGSASVPSSVPSTHMPVAVTPSRGELPTVVEIATRRDAGSWPVDNLTSLEITDLTATVDGMVLGTQIDQTLPEDSDNTSPYDDPADGAFTTLVTVPAGTTKLIAETIFSEAPDLDLFVGLDANLDGIPQEAEEVCVSASGSALEYCELTGPAEGQYWILIQNWAGSGAAEDALTLSYAVLDGTATGNMTVDGPDTVPQLEPFGIRVFWDEGNLAEGDKAYATVSLGTDPGNAGNIGSFPVELVREADDVTKAVSPVSGEPGDTLTFTVTIQPNVTVEDLTYTITDTIPDGLTYVDGSATNGATVTDGEVSWSDVLASPFLAEQFFVMSTSASDPSCDTGFGGYIDLEGFGITADPGISGDTVAFTAFGTQNPINFFGTDYTGFGFADDGFAYFGTGYGGAPWEPQAIPDAAAPNNVAAGLWHDFEIFYDLAANTGVTLATAGPDVAVVEYDDLELFGGSDPVLDMNIVVASLDDTPGFFEVVYAYDNVDASLLGDSTIGVENATGTDALAYLNNAAAAAAIADGFQVCFDWQGPAFEPVTFSYDVTVDDGAEPAVVTNEVIHDTDNPGSQPATTSVDVEILASGEGAADQLAAAIDTLDDLIGDADPEDVDALNTARQRLVSASKASLWTSDDTLAVPRGIRMFRRIRRAINALQHVSEDSSVYDGVQDVIWSVVTATQNVAATAIDQAIADGAPDGQVDRATLRFNRATRAEVKGKAKKAVLMYGNSWKVATKYLK